MFRGPKVLTLHNARFPTRAGVTGSRRTTGGCFVAPPPSSRSPRRPRRSMGRYADFQSTIIPNGIDAAYWRARPSSPLSAARDAKPRLSRPARGTQRTRGGDRSVQADRAFVAGRAAVDGGRRPDARWSAGAGPGGAARARRVSRRGVRRTSGAARFVVGVPASGAGGRLLDHGARGLRGGLAGGGASRARQRSGRRSLVERR